ncbi:FAD-dependent oxidoreductase [Spirillospora sp. CA-108201]
MEDRTPSQTSSSHSEPARSGQPAAGGGLDRRRFVTGAITAAGAVAAAGALGSGTARAAAPAARRAPRTGRAAAGRRVAIFGGGMGGLSTAHELAERGFQVTVYERKAWGGKCRSMPVPNTAGGGRQDLPAEHGFRFFPGFYQNLPDTMSRIPLPGGGRAFENLVAVIRSPPSTRAPSSPFRRGAASSARSARTRCWPSSRPRSTWSAPSRRWRSATSSRR